MLHDHRSIDLELSILKRFSKLQCIKFIGLKENEYFMEVCPQLQALLTAIGS